MHLRLFYALKLYFLTYMIRSRLGAVQHILDLIL